MSESRKEKIENAACFSICLALAILYFVPLPLNMWTFHFIHANVFHLLVNMIAITSIFKHPRAIELITAYLLGSILWSLTYGNIVGFSAIIFYMWGARFPSIVKGVQEKKVLRKYLAALVITFIIPLFINNVSFSLHFLPFMVAAISMFTRQLYRQYASDIKDLNL